MEYARYKKSEYRQYFNWYKNFDEDFKSLFPECEEDFFEDFESNINGFVFSLFMEGKPAGFVICQKVNYKPVIFNLCVFVDREYRNSGLATWASNAIATDFLEKRVCDKIVINCAENNSSVNDYCKENGWTKEATFSKEFYRDGKYIDGLRYYKMRNDL